MLNAINSLSASESLLTFPLWNNMMLVYAVALSMALHFAILYVPFLQGLFSILPLDRKEWVAVLAFSAPVVVIDEVLKFLDRRFYNARAEIGGDALSSSSAGKYQNGVAKRKGA